MMRPARAQAGFALLELVVACAVMLVALLLAAELLEESGRILAHSAARERDPWAPLTNEWLRDDVRAARAPTAPIGAWLSAPLPLVLDTGPAGAQLVRWRRLGSTLVREEVGGPTRTLLQQVDGWRWRLLPGNALEAEVRFRRGGSFLRNLAGSLPQPDQPREETLHWLVVMRGGGTDSW